MRRLVLVLLLACGGSSSSNPSGSAQPLLVQIVSGQSSTISGPGGMLQLAAYKMVGGSYGMGGSLEEVPATWSSSNPAVATVDANGLVTGVADGTAVITARYASASGQYTVIVGPQPPG
jgi:hypothetical protein